VDLDEMHRSEGQEQNDQVRLIVSAAHHGESTAPESPEGTLQDRNQTREGPSSVGRGPVHSALGRWQGIPMLIAAAVSAMTMFAIVRPVDQMRRLRDRIDLGARPFHLVNGILRNDQKEGPQTEWRRQLHTKLSECKGEPTRTQRCRGPGRPLCTSPTPPSARAAPG